MQHSIHRSDQLASVIQPCDILLVEGELWVSGAIKYLTQSTWSHSAMYVGDIIDPDQHRDDPKVLIEADIKEGVIGVPLSKYEALNTRICRPVGLSVEDKSKVISYMMRNLGNSYDLKNVFDLARYLIPTPPVPVRFRRKMIGLGSGDPTRAICSSLIAQAFQTVRYPILPEVSGDLEEEIYRIRHSTLFAPRDFDLSPYFDVIKPTIELAQEYKSMKWEDRQEDGEDPVKVSSS
jgi:hypothetical protein